MSNPRFNAISDFIETEIAKGIFPGAGLIVAQRGERIFERYWGVYCSRTRRDVPMASGVRHMLYSFSKAVSATAFVIAHQKGLIDYDAPVSRYIPEYRGGLKDRTTIRHLITHSAGLQKCALKDAYTEEAWQACIRACCEAEVDFEPGVQTLYHATQGQILAAEAVRRTMGNAPWEDICREFVLDPIGADTLSFRAPDHEPVALTLFMRKIETLPCPINPEIFGSMGQPGAGVFGTLDDVCKLIQLHLNGGTWSGRVIIKPEELREMHRVQYEAEIAEAERTGSVIKHQSYGLGWMIRRKQANTWWGLGATTSPETFGHTGIDTVLGVGEPRLNLAIAFLATGSPNQTGDNAIRVRNRVTDLIIDEIKVP